MARKVKETSPEDRLAAALVLAEEQPYQVPENWCWAHMEHVYQINPKVVANDDTPAAFIPMEKIGAGIDSTFSFEMQPWRKAKKGHTQFADGDVAFAKISPCFENMKSMIVQNLPNGIGGGTTELIVLRNPFIDQKYTYYQVCSNRFIQGGCQTYSGTVGQQRISMNYVRSFPISLPPLLEQHRIVERIESLFAKLDEAKDEAQAVIDGYEDRKAAILHRAFTGELTEGWRRDKGINSESWKKILFGTIIVAGPQNGLYKSKDVYGQGYRILRIDGFYDGWIESWNTLKRLSLTPEEYALYQLNIDDIVVNRVNSMPYLGKSALVRELPEPCVFESNMMRIAINKEIAIPEYIIKFLNSTLGLLELRKNAKQAVNQASINQTDVKNVEIPLPTLPEQHEIVCRLDILLSHEAEIKSAAEETLATIATLKQSILARAFRGELGTNDAADEPAIELLKRTLEV